MSTAQEMMLFMDAMAPHMDIMRSHLKAMVGPMIEDALISMLGREVGAKRARKLQRRGAKIRFSRVTSTGKRRYRWVPASTVELRMP